MLTTGAVVALALLSAACADDAGNQLQLNNTHPAQPAEVAEKYFINKIFDKYGDKGLITFEEPTLVIMEFVSLGKLQQFLRDSRAERHYGNTHAGSQFLTSRDLTHFAFQVARGMDFLSSKGVIGNIQQYCYKQEEIIGNRKNVARLQKHFKKMFAGVAAIILNEDNTVINGIASREGEEVYFISPVSTVENPKINSWLSMVEREMRVTLACRLKDAVADVKQFKDGNVDPQKFIDWCDKYQAQIVVLAAQILWAEDVDAALTNGGGEGLKKVLSHVENMLNILADSVLQEQPPLRRRKLEHLQDEMSAEDKMRGV